MCYFLLLAYLKYQTKYAHSLYYRHRLIKASLFLKLTFIDLLNLTQRRLARVRDDNVQLAFNF